MMFINFYILLRLHIVLFSSTLGPIQLRFDSRLVIERICYRLRYKFHTRSLNAE